MKQLLRRFGYLRLLALVLTMAPFLLLPPLGLLWLWQVQGLLYWLGALLVFGFVGYGLHWLDTRRQLRALEPTGASPDWPAGSAGAWERVEALAERTDPDDWALDDPERLWALGRLALEEVANHYHPGREQPLLELTLPHALLIIERASRDLRLTISEHVPFSHQLTLGGLTRMRSWSRRATRLEGVYRAGRALADPLGGVLREFSRAVGHRIVGYGSTRLRHWLLREYVRKVGYYGVELYSGHLLLSEPEPRESEEEPFSEEAEPLRVLVLGRTNAGKSSLINGLFGRLAAATNTLADTTRELNAYRLERDGETRALVFDAPGIDSDHLPEKALRKVVLQADLILWVTAAPRPDRQTERALLERIRGWLAAEAATRAPAPIILVVSHIDQLSPVREWDPPYDLQNPTSPKARTISAALRAVADDFALPDSELVPVSLAEERLYNVDDGVWAAILNSEDQARRARFLRLLPKRQRAENWALTWRQLANTGRLLKGRKSQ